MENQISLRNLCKERWNFQVKEVDSPWNFCLFFFYKSNIKIKFKKEDNQLSLNKYWIIFFFHSGFIFLQVELRVNAFESFESRVGSVGNRKFRFLFGVLENQPHPENLSEKFYDPELDGKLLLLDKVVKSF